MAQIEQKETTGIFPKEQVVAATILPEVIQSVQTTLTRLTGEQPPAMMVDNFEFVSPQKLVRLSTKQDNKNNLLYLILEDAGAKRRILREYFPQPKSVESVFAHPLDYPNKIFLEDNFCRQGLIRENPNLAIAYVLGLHLIYVNFELWPKKESTDNGEVKAIALGWLQGLFEEFYKREKDFKEPEKLVAGFEFMENIFTDPQSLEFAIFGTKILIFTKEKTGAKLQFSINDGANLVIAKLFQHDLADFYLRVFVDQFLTSFTEEVEKQWRAKLKVAYQNYQRDQAAPESLEAFVAKRELARQFLQKLGFNKPANQFSAFVTNQILPAYFAQRVKKPELDAIFTELAS